MPNYTTSYSTKKKPRYRKSTGNRLSSGGASHRRRRGGGQYLRRSQGFGAKKRGGRGHGDNARKPYALVVVGCALLLFLASIVWYANRGVDVTLNGETVSVRINSNIEQLIEGQSLDLRAGNLLAVDDSVLEKGGGDRCAVTLDGDEVPVGDLANVELTGGEELTIGDGADVYEEHVIQATEIQPTLTVEGSGAVRFVETWGVPGRSEVWTGKVSGKTQDRGVVQEVVDCVVQCASVSPDGEGSYMALTFDEGPSQNTQKILDILEEKNVKATFFLSGDHAEEYPAAVKAIADAGHEIGSNTYSDVSLSELSGDDLRSQITRGFEAIEQAGGGSAGLLRPPYAAFSERNWAEAMDLFGAVVTWNIDSGDWLLPGAQSVIDTVAGSARNGNIVLVTDNDTTSSQLVEALPDLIDRLQEDGYTLVTVSDLIATDGDLADAVSTGAASMPANAVLPQVETASTGDA